LIARSSLALALLMLPVVAHAQSPRSVSLDVARCEGGSFDALAVIDAARVELAADGIPDVHAVAEPGDGAIARIRISPDCADVDAFVVHIDDLVTQKSIERAIVLEEMPSSAVPRALAIAAAELLRASWAELELVDAAEQPPAIVDALRVRVRGLREARALSAPDAAAAPAPVEAHVPVEEPPSTAAIVGIYAEGVVRAFPGGGVAPLGGRLALDVMLGAQLRLGIDGEVVFGSAIHPLGSIDLGLASGGLSLRYDAAIDVVRLGLGARVAAGAGWTQGHPSAGGVVGAGGDGFVLLVGGVLVVALPLGDIVSLRLDVEGGGAAVGFEAYVDRAPVAGLVGGYLAASLGIALFV